MNYWALLNPYRANIEGLSHDYNRDFNTNAVVRNNWVSSTLANIPAGLRILDAGAGEQQYRHLCSHLEYVAQDFAQYDGKGDNKGLQSCQWDREKLDIVSDITNIPEDDESFDAVLCTEVFEHLPDPIMAIKEFFRLLRKDGHLIITAPFCSLTHQSPYHFYSGFNRYFFEKKLSEHGFEIIEMSANGNYFKYVAQELNRIPSTAFTYVGGGPTKIEFIALRILLAMLKRFSDKDQGSTDLLNFGYHVHAIKR